jgi:hypothetical protein
MTTAPPGQLCPRRRDQTARCWTLLWRQRSPAVDLLGWAPSTVGNAIETVFDPGGNLVFTGTYLTVGKKQPDGTWRYVVST